MWDRHLPSDPGDTGPLTSHGADPTPTRLDGPARYREPAVATRLVSRPASSTARAWAGTFTRARLLAATALTPLLFVAYRGAIQGTPSGLGWTVLLLAVAAIGALALATYLPQRPRAGRVSSSCAAVAGIWVFLAGVALSGPADVVNGLLALGAVSFALLQRLRGSQACGISGSGT
jgi:hypothetical protein